MSFWLNIALAPVILATAYPATAAQSDGSALKITGVERIEKLNALFRNSPTWLGGDCAYSFPLPDNSSLFLMGDSSVKLPAHPNRLFMVNNSVVFLRGYPTKSNIQFCNRGAANNPRPVFGSDHANEWIWPGDGIILDGRLAVVLHRIRKAVKPAPEEFQFDWFADDLCIVDNPQDEPTKWISRTFPLPRLTGDVLYGVACCQDSQFFYMYCSSKRDAKQLDAHPVILARMEKSKLTKCRSLDGYPTDWQFWSAKNGWTVNRDDASVLFPDAAPEMSVTFIPNLDSYVAIYMPPLSNRIMCRTAERPEGPFSAASQIFLCPESALEVNEKKVGVYSAKAHPELSNLAVELVVSYCSNPGGLAELQKRPDLYFPTFIRLSFQGKRSRP